MMKSSYTDPRSAPYYPVGSARRLWTSRATELLLSGPAGTGKSRGCLEYLHWAADRYPKMRGAIVRKTRASLTQSAMVTLEKHVLPEGWLGNFIQWRTQEQEYRYPNESTIVVAGIDNPTKIRSAEYDIIYVQEAIELTIDDWEDLTGRLRNGRTPIQRLIADTNPGAPKHWLKQRCDAGSCEIVYCNHKDNPRFYNQHTGKWTREGKAYRAMLDKLTGVRLARLRYGRWVQAEGVVYDDYDPNIHLIDRFDIPRDWARFWVIDFGYTNPFVWQCWAVDPDGRVILYKEIYRTQTLVEDHAKAILEATNGEPLPEAIICDHDAEDRATLERHLNLNTVAARKTVSDGIQAVKSRLRPAGDGKPRLYMMRDSLLGRDSRLDDRKAPASTLEEIDGYIWSPIVRATAGGRTYEEPVKKDDHGMDAMRYLIAHLDCEYHQEFDELDDDLQDSFRNFYGK